MLTQKEHDAMIMFDRLLMAAEENETIADLLDQTLNVARMIDPKHDEKITYGPLQRMHFEWQQMKYRMDSIEKKMDNYINQQNRYGGTYNGNTTFGPNIGYPTMASSTSMWPSNPGLDNAGGYLTGYGAIPPISATSINKYDTSHDEKIKDLTDKLRKIAEAAKKEVSDLENEAK